MLNWIKRLLGYREWKLYCMTSGDIIICSECGHEDNTAPKKCGGCGAKMLRGRALKEYLEQRA